MTTTTKTNADRIAMHVKDGNHDAADVIIAQNCPGARAERGYGGRSHNELRFAIIYSDGTRKCIATDPHRFIGGLIYIGIGEADSKVLRENDSDSWLYNSATT